MWADAGEGFFGLSPARANPLRWSKLAGLEYAARDIEQYQDQELFVNRPVRIWFMHSAANDFRKSAAGEASEERVFGSPAAAVRALRAAMMTQGHQVAAVAAAVVPPAPPGNKRKRRKTVQARVVVSNPGRIDDSYSMEPDVRPGDFASVRRARRKGAEGGDELAVRTERRPDPAKVGQFNAWVEIMREMIHPNVVRLLETFADEDGQRIYFVTEFCTGGDLFDAVECAGQLTEVQAATVTRQMLLAVAHVHDRGVVHRGLSAENLVLQAPGDVLAQRLKLKGFELACRCKPGEALTDKVGHASYVAPEVLEGSYGSPCDLWGCGVVVFVCLTGSMPFPGGGKDDVLKQVMRGIVLPQSWDNVSEGARDLVEGLMATNPCHRPTANEALQHEWLSPGNSSCSKHTNCEQGH